MDSEKYGCPPCSGDCRQGRDCPAFLVIVPNVHNASAEEHSKPEPARAFEEPERDDLDAAKGILWALAAGAVLGGVCVWLASRFWGAV